MLIDDIFPKRDIGKKNKYGQSADHNGKNLVPSKAGPGTRNGDDGRSGGLDSRHLQSTGSWDGTHAGIPGNDCQVVIDPAVDVAAKKTWLGAKAIFLIRDAAEVEHAFLEAASGAGRHGVEADGRHLGTCGIEPILREHPIEPVAAPGA